MYSELLASTPAARLSSAGQRTLGSHTSRHSPPTISASRWISPKNPGTVATIRTVTHHRCHTEVDFAAAHPSAKSQKTPSAETLDALQVREVEVGAARFGDVDAVHVQ